MFLEMSWTSKGWNLKPYESEIDEDDIASVAPIKPKRKFPWRETKVVTPKRTAKLELRPIPKLIHELFEDDPMSQSSQDTQSQTTQWSQMSVLESPAKPPTIIYDHEIIYETPEKRPRTNAERLGLPSIDISDLYFTCSPPEEAPDDTCTLPLSPPDIV